MKGLSGWVFGLGATVAAFVLWLLVLVSYVFIKEPNMTYFYATGSGFLVMLAFVGLIYADEKRWIDFPNSYYDVLGPAWTVAAIIVACCVLVY